MRAGELAWNSARSGLRLHDGTLEALKWIALAAMVVDHVGALVFGHDKGSWSHQWGRMAFPLFALVLGAKLALRTAQSGRVRGASVVRLAAWGIASMPAFVAATGRWWPPDIFFTLALGTAVCWIATSDWRPPARWAAYLTAALLSFGCDYFAPGVFLVPAAWRFCRSPGAGAALALLLCAAGLAFVNWSAFPLLAFAVAPLAMVLPLRVPPTRHFFYAFYPAHLALIAAWVHWH